MIYLKSETIRSALILHFGHLYFVIFKGQCLIPKIIVHFTENRFVSNDLSQMSQKEAKRSMGLNGYLKGLENYFNDSFT